MYYDTVTENRDYKTFNKVIIFFLYNEEFIFFLSLLPWYSFVILFISALCGIHGLFLRLDFFFSVSVYCQSLLLHTNFKFRHHWKNSHWRFSELSLVGSNSDFIRKIAVFSCCMMHRPFQTLPKMSEKSYWIPQQEVTKALHIISRHFHASFLTQQKKPKFHDAGEKKKVPHLHRKK